MGNPLRDMIDLVAPSGVPTFVGRLVNIQGDKATVRMASGTLQTVWGSNLILGSTVLIKNGIVIAKVAAESVITVSVP